MTLNELFDLAGGRIRRYTPTEAHAAAQAGAVIVDIRDHFSREHDGVIPGAHHVPRTVLEWRIASDDYRNPALENKRLILVCDHGFSTVFAASMLVDLGVDVGDVIGGFEAWKADGLETAVAKQYDGQPGNGPPD
ncbi:MAG TPA: rhodanese-like domain-containing protein [Gaiellaceae bacterium]|jgi:rhodanese-related sulfurtransferase